MTFRTSVVSLFLERHAAAKKKMFPNRNFKEKVFLVREREREKRSTTD